MRIRVGCARIIDPLHLRANRLVFQLHSCDADRRANTNERVKFRGRFTLQTNATVRPGHGMNETLRKSIARWEPAPKSNRVTKKASDIIRADSKGHAPIDQNEATTRSGR